MKAAVQCPNCGGFRTRSRTVFRNAASFKIIPNGQARARFFIGLGLAAVGALLSFILIAVGSWGVFLGIPLFFVTLGLTHVSFNRLNLQLDHTEFDCLLCEHTWLVRPGDPLPEIRVRPDLIQRGERKLRDEERRWQARIWWDELMRIR